MNHALVLYSISTLSLILGFVALLKQKTYIDAETRHLEEVSVPFLGKMKTNYPALIFVFLGAGLALATFNKDPPGQKVEWRITGKLEDPEGTGISWPDGHFSSFPRGFSSSISQNGFFEIYADVEDGKSLEEYFDTLDYSHPRVSTSIDLADEYQRFAAGKESLIKTKTNTTWKFKPIVVGTWFAEERESL